VTTGVDVVREYTDDVSEEAEQVVGYFNDDVDDTADDEVRK